jgi:dolichol-phosphate mannosyltransferase
VITRTSHQILAPQRAIVIPAYLESDALPMLIAELIQKISDTDLIVVIDDSPTKIANETATRCLAAAQNRSWQIHIDTSGQRTGRGGAVRRGFKLAFERWSSIHWFVECDADGSHRATDIIRALEHSSPVDLLIGSRYLPQSKIIGWTVSRRLQSRLLNVVIPRILGLEIHDVTNGLRRYSRAAISGLLDQAPVSSTFIYLAEQAYIVHQAGFSMSEIPIIFEERRAGTSSVTWRELNASLQGLLRITRLRKIACNSDAL